MKQIKMNSGLHVAVFVALFWLLPSAEVASAQSKVNIVHVGGVASWSVLLPIAQEQGLFTKHGVEVQLVLVPEAEVPRLTGENPFGYIGAPAAILRAAGGTDLKILGSFNTGRVSSHVVVRPDIKQPEELRGKRFGVRALGAGAWIQTILALEYLGLDPKRDNISTLAIGDPTMIAGALEAGTIDAAVLSPAQSHQLRAKGFSVLLDLYPANIYGFQNALVVTATYLQQYPDVVEKVVTALVEAMAFSLAPTNKPTVLRTIMKLFNLTDLAAAERGYKDLADLNRKPYPSVERLRNMQRVMALHDPKVLDLRVEDLIEDRFVRKLDETGVIDRLYSTDGVK
jgi:ABC-type nitrate/sulfonate/bicarbonate transport system substrate-binding protein